MNSDMDDIVPLHRDLQELSLDKPESESIFIVQQAKEDSFSTGKF